MKKLFSQMSREELELEMLQSLEAMEKAEFPSQKELLERKYYTAKAYTLNPLEFPPGIYKVIGHPVDASFKLNYINGIMGWGEMGEDLEASFPLSMLLPY
ncbi:MULTISPECIES: YfhH family protein [Paenibacillus]|uniref:YfhH family protein n=1 Tax=Paenibacillus radicis (ex Xue et al. 2023) TaxID=2972489 RepID=A0ABT1YK18_9BACL|nr:YfhH family protein [Paenibacillus radicis (ex Xue et al. 2023)]MCR8633535.1 YfhH family protein [Paenibacillus radicis (ex Xue et al. 2023)]